MTDYGATLDGTKSLRTNQLLKNQILEESLGENGYETRSIKRIKTTINVTYYVRFFETTS